MTKFAVRKNAQGKLEILDRIRKKYVLCTDEEKVRQMTILYLTETLNVPMFSIAVETEIKVNNLSKRTDVVVFNSKMKPVLIVECKAPSVKISQDVFDQIARYNLTLQVNYLMVTNGVEQYFCHLDFEKQSYQFIPELPDWSAF
ncbi:MAG: type I restriction enzyme HsdR N-terminal domain-containing protein [Bacteroidales bacterium]|nr:type I restriction enzyme HsdR N-terminal domain-containing protein [Bacteroidales bacterium]